MLTKTKVRGSHRHLMQNIVAQRAGIAAADVLVSLVGEKDLDIAFTMELEGGRGLRTGKWWFGIWAASEVANRETN